MKIHHLGILLLAATLYGCNSDEQTLTGPEGRHTVTAQVSKAATRTLFAENQASGTFSGVSVSWSASDAIGIYCNDDITTLEEFKATSVNGAKATFQNTESAFPATATVKAIYPYRSDLTYDLSSQAGTLEALGSYDIMTAKGNMADYLITGLGFKSSVIIIRLPQGLTVAAAGSGAATISFSGGNVANKIVYPGRQMTVGSVTVPAELQDGKLLQDVYLTFIDAGNSSTSYALTTSCSGKDYTYALTKDTGFNTGQVYTITSLTKEGKFAGGTGTQADPYLIANATHMQNMEGVLTENDQAVYFRMIADVDMSGVDWHPFNEAAPFKKKIDFDGDGHTIRDFTCRNQHYASFAGVLYGKVANVKFTGAAIEGTGNSHIGIVAGYLGTYVDDIVVFGEIENVSAEGSVTQKSNDVFAGGLVGNQRYGTIKNCYVKADVVAQTAGDRGVGGITGYLYDNKNLKNPTDEVNTLIMNSYFEGSVKASCCVGGILGKGENRYGNYMYGNISNASSLTGDAVGTVAGRAYQACMEEKKIFHDNYGSRDAVLSVPLDINGAFYNNTSTNVYYGAPFDGTASATARTIGWDEQTWDLSGDTPKLKSFE